MANTNKPTNFYVYHVSDGIAHIRWDLPVRSNFSVEVHTSADAENGFVLEKTIEAGTFNTAITGDFDKYVKIRSKNDSSNDLSDFTDAIIMKLADRESAATKQSVERLGATHHSSVVGDPVAVAAENTWYDAITFDALTRARDIVRAEMSIVDCLEVTMQILADGDVVFEEELIFSDSGGHTSPHSFSIDPRCQLRRGAEVSLQVKSTDTIGTVTIDKLYIVDYDL